MKALTERQREVLIHATLGHSMNETAEGMNLSPNTVKQHRERVMKKLEAKTITNAVAKAMREELIQ